MSFVVGVLAAFIAFIALIFVSAFFGMIGPIEMIAFLVIATFVGVLAARRRANA
jgi:hypothetical protein